MQPKDISKHNLYWRRDVTYPVTSRNVIIFPFNFKVLEFVSNFYTPEMTDNHIQAAQIETFLDEIQNTCNTFSELRTWETFFFKSFYCSIAISLLFLFFLERSFPKLAVIFFIVSVSLGVLAIIYNILRVPWIFSNYRKKILGLIKYSNDTYFKAMGMKLALSPKNFDWIELWLEYRYKNEPNQAYFNDYGESSKKYHGGNSQYVYPYIPCNTTKQGLPPSTPNSILFPFDYKKFDFYFHFYNADMSDNMVSYQDVEDIFRCLKREAEDYTVISSRIKWEIINQVLQWTLVGLAFVAGIYVPADFLDGHKILIMLACFFAPYLLQMFRSESREMAMSKVRDTIERQLVILNYNYKKDKIRWVLSKSEVDYIEMWNYGKLAGSGNNTEKLDVSFSANTEADDAIDNDTNSLLKK